MAFIKNTSQLTRNRSKAIIRRQDIHVAPISFSSSHQTCSSLIINHQQHHLENSSSLKSKRKGFLSSLSWLSTCLLLSAVLLLSASTGGLAEAKHAWERPGCHKVGHTRKVTIPECVEFTITTNACRGYCESFAVPSAWYRLQNNPSQAITSVGQCCNIMETEDVTVNVMCMEGQKELVFKSAKSCACYHCKKD